MPELPEVETTRRGIEPHLSGRRIECVVVRQAKLRWPIPAELPQLAAGQPVQSVRRRAKYLLIELPNGTLILHLGMSGSLRVVDAASPPGPHDHLDIVLDDGRALRLTDPRRFGAVLWSDDPAHHPLLTDLGPEPLDDAFDGEWLYRRSRGRRTAVKNLIMDSKVVVGVGNIYASESLFRAGIHPSRRADRISRERYDRLAEAIRSVLGDAIRAGGTTLRDFVASDGKPGYFAQELAVYGREGEPCRRCRGPIRQTRTGQRSTWYCPACQR